MSVAQGHTMQESAWSETTNHWLGLVVGKIGKQYPDLKSFRLVCQHWRLAGSGATSTVKGQSIGHRHATVQEVNAVFSNLYNFQSIILLPFKYLPCLTATPGKALHTLILTGTATATVCELYLPHCTSLKNLSFEGSTAMTDVLLSSLSHLPQLWRLTFHKVLFPRIPFAQSCFHDAYFACLEKLRICHCNPLDSNGKESGPAGQQFVLSLPHLKYVLFGMGTVDELMQEILNRVAMLKRLIASVPRSVAVSFAETKADEWTQWSQQRGVQFYWIHSPWSEECS